MAESDLKTFQCEAFAKDLAAQASQVVPADISAEGKEFIVEIINRYCKMAGDALVNEQNSKLNAQQASLITQFIGEWIFHKSVDIIRAKIDPKYREGILQKVAFTVFDIAKKAVEKDIPQEQLVTLVETQVKKCFTKAIEELREKGLITKEATDDAMTQSNIDAMAAKEVQEETAKDIETMSDSKIIKLASLAVLIKNFPTERLKGILQKFNKPERDVLIQYLKMPDLEQRLDTNATMRCIEEMKNTLPEVVVVSYDRAYKKLCKIVKNSSKDELLNIINNERLEIREFVMACCENKKKKIPAHIADIIVKYLEENVS